MLMRCYPFPRGQGRLIDRTPLHALRFDETSLLVRTVDGFSMQVFPNDHIGRHLYLTGQFDRTIVEVLLRFAVPDARVLDIGANCGYVACALLHRLPECRVVSVEPQESVHALLADNLRRVGAGRGWTLQAAVSDAAGTGSMVHAVGNTGASRLEPGSDVAPLGVPPADRVEVITGAMLMERSGLDRLDLVKIDVEGHEEAVLRTLQPILARWRPRAVLFEHEGDLEDPASRLARGFHDLDYRVLGIHKRLTRYELVPVERLAAEGRHAHDYVAVPRETADET
jgi:FkbM family methyltransferase